MISASIPNPIRKAVYRRDHFRCALCDSPKYIQIHHVVPRSQGGDPVSMHNLITLCSVCHGIAHGGIEATEWEMYPEEVNQACIEYVADMYAPRWDPYFKRGR